MFAGVVCEHQILALHGGSDYLSWSKFETMSQREEHGRAQYKFFVIKTPGSETPRPSRPAAVPTALNLRSFPGLASSLWPSPRSSKLRRPHPRRCSLQENPPAPACGWSCRVRDAPFPLDQSSPAVLVPVLPPGAFSPPLFLSRCPPPLLPGHQFPRLFRSTGPPRHQASSPRLLGLLAPTPRSGLGSCSCSRSRPSRPAAVPAPAPSAPQPPRVLGPALRGRGGRGSNAEQPLPSAAPPLTLQGLEDRLRHLGATASTGAEATLREHCGSRGGGDGGGGWVAATRGRP